ncbi:unnamed protein product [Meloidogyne enterolobii]|uniref:Uncharacterized protein n=2 Tax=Meloidogyne enterolobii TaxID=390850 RepID=A0ACB1B4V4_MELEN|nr:unnamed protein product [Meloidogyne enterolobii]
MENEVYNNDNEEEKRFLDEEFVEEDWQLKIPRESSSPPPKTFFEKEKRLAPPNKRSTKPKIIYSSSSMLKYPSSSSKSFYQQLEPWKLSMAPNLFPTPISPQPLTPLDNQRLFNEGEEEEDLLIQHRNTSPVHVDALRDLTITMLGPAVGGYFLEKLFFWF